MHLIASLSGAFCQKMKHKLGEIYSSVENIFLCRQWKVQIHMKEIGMSGVMLVA